MRQFIFPVKVYIEDTDYSGMVFHANYLNYFERARTESVETLGMGIEWQAHHEIYFPVCSIQIDYLKPARLNNQLEVVSQIVNIKKASLIYDQHLRLANSPDTILCRATVKIACVNKHIRPCAIPRSGLHEISMGETE